MDRSLFIAMNGAKQTLLAQTANANNLANSQTTGFKADLEQSRAMQAFGPGYPTRVYSMTERPGTIMAAGELQTSGRDLDISINGEGWFAVQAPEGGEAYTRAGDLRMTPEGLLVNGGGYKFLGESGQPIAIPPADKVEVGRDGTISIIPQGSSQTALVVVDRLKLVNPGNDNLEKLQDGLMHTKPGAAAPQPDANINVLQGTLEGSNVNTMAAMVDLIELSRNFELQSKVMKNADDNAAVSARLMQMA